jgi:hypothetical protein
MRIKMENVKSARRRIRRNKCSVNTGEYLMMTPV